MTVLPALRALLRRELRLLVLAPGGLLLVGLWALLVGAVFLMELLAFEQAEQRALALEDPALLALVDVNDLLLASVHHHQLVLLLFLSPLLAMRVWGDGGTARAWVLHRVGSTRTWATAKALTAGAGVAMLVATASALTVLVGLIAQTPAGTDGPAIDIAQALLAATTSVLAGWALVSVAGVVVVIVDHPLAGALLGFVAVALWWLLPSAGAMAGPGVADALTFLSLAGHVDAGLRGVVSPSDLLFAGSVIVAGALASAAVVEGRR